MPGPLPDSKQNTAPKIAAMPKGQRRKGFHPKKLNTEKTSPIGQDLPAVETHCRNTHGPRQSGYTKKERR